MVDRAAQPAVAELQFTVVSLMPPALKRGHARFEQGCRRCAGTTASPGAEPVPLPALRLSPRLDISSMNTAACRILTFMSLRLSGIASDRRSANTLNRSA